MWWPSTHSFLSVHWVSGEVTTCLNLLISYLLEDYYVHGIGTDRSVLCLSYYYHITFVSSNMFAWKNTMKELKDTLSFWFSLGSKASYSACSLGKIHSHVTKDTGLVLSLYHPLQQESHKKILRYRYIFKHLLSIYMTIKIISSCFNTCMAWGRGYNVLHQHNAVQENAQIILLTLKSSVHDAGAVYACVIKVW